MNQQTPHPYADLSPYALWPAGKTLVTQTLVQ